MSITTISPRKFSHHPHEARVKAVKAKPEPASPIRAPTTLAKKMPDYIHPPKKRKRIVANVNVGWGNAVYVRGDGSGLSWHVGTPLVCEGNNLWVWSYPEDDAPIEIKFLRNDVDWALGENHVVTDEDILIFTPEFS